MQGSAGDCYFLASVAALAESHDRIEEIFGNKMEINGYGIYKVIVNDNG